MTATWRAAAALAAEVDATDAFATGLRMAEGGPALADRLGLPSQVPLEIALAPNHAPPGTLTLERFFRARGMRRRMTMIRYAVAPPPSVMREWLRPGRTDLREFARGYARRAARVVRSAPAALSAWARAHRSARSKPGELHRNRDP